MIKCVVVVLALFCAVYGVDYNSLTASDKTYILNAHNRIRANVPVDFPSNAPSTCLNRIEWDRDLAHKAELWAKDCPSDYNPDPECNGGKCGQSRFTTTATYGTVESAMRAFEKEKEQYSYRAYVFSEETRSYSQMVWNDTVLMGCALREGCNTRASYKNILFCYYYPAGNLVGKFPWVQKEGNETAAVCASVFVKPVVAFVAAVMVLGMSLFF